MRRTCWVLLAMALSGCAQAFAEAPNPVVTVHPTELKIPAGGRAQVWVLLENSGTTDLLDLHLTVCPDGAVELVTPVPAIKRLPAGGIQRWTIELAARTALDEAAQRCTFTDVPMALGGKVLLRVDYVWRESEDKPRVNRSVLGTLAVAEREPEVVESPIQAEIKSLAEVLDEYRPGVLQVVVSNTSDRVVELTGLRPQPSNPTSAKNKPLLEVSVREASFPIVLRPADVRMLSVDVHPGDAVPSGKYWVVLDLDLRWRQGSRVHEMTRALSTEVQVGVFAESALLTAVGVPTFLLLPGFLMVAAFGLLARHVSKSPITEEWDFLLDFKDKGFWILAVTASILMAIAYHPATLALGWPRNYLRGYGIKDIVVVWSASLLLALAAFGARELGVWRRLRDHFRPGDPPLAVLEKLARQGRTLFCEQHNVDHQRLMLLEPRHGEKTKVWMAPRVLLTWSANPPEDLQTEVRKLSVANGPVAEVLPLLTLGLRKKVLRLDWDSSVSVKGPREVEETKLASTATKYTLLVVEGV